MSSSSSSRRLLRSAGAPEEDTRSGDLLRRLEERLRALEANNSLARRVFQLERASSVQGWHAVVQGLEGLSTHFFLKLALACACAGMVTAAFACALAQLLR